MSTTYWDPKRLLNIRVYDNRVKCVGKKSSNTGACSCLPPDTKYSGFHDLIREISSTRPQNVSTSTLSSLALVCLCKAYHQHQRHSVARQWQDKIRNAVSGQECLSSSSMLLGSHLQNSNANSARLDLGDLQRTFNQMQQCFQLERETICQNCNETDQLRAVLLKERQDTALRLEASAKALRAESAMRRDAETEVTCFRNKLSAVKENSETKIQAIQGDSEQKSVQIEALKSEVDQIKTEKQQLQQRTTGIEEKHLHLNQSIEKLREEAAIAAEREQATVDKFENQKTDLRDRSAMLKEKDNRISTLEERIAMLELEKDELGKSISTCWWHKVKARISRTRGTEVNKS